MYRPGDGNDRQEEILDLASHGFTFHEVAEKLGITHHAVLSLSKRLYRRLGARNAAHAVRRGFEAGMLIPNAHSDTVGLRAENDALRAELGRVYRALAVANGEPTRRVNRVKAHWFGTYLLDTGQAA